MSITSCKTITAMIFHKIKPYLQLDSCTFNMILKNLYQHHILANKTHGSNLRLYHILLPSIHGGSDGCISCITSLNANFLAPNYYLESKLCSKDILMHYYGYTREKSVLLKHGLHTYNSHRTFITSSTFQKPSKELYPPLDETELEETFIRGSGPGGQNVNKLANCVMLRHVPTGVVIKCHETRSLDKNRVLARVRMQERLDWYFNRENSIKEQEKRAASAKRYKQKQKTKKKLEKLKALKERISEDSKDSD